MFPNALHDLEQYSLYSIGSLIPHSYKEERLPSVRQCVGTNRLWGARLGQALYDDLSGLIDLTELVDIAIISRSILVIDDHLDDEYLDSDDAQSTLEFIDNLENKLFTIFKIIGEDPICFKDLRNKSKTEVNRRKLVTNVKDIYRSSINKCLIFFNPYRLNIVENLETLRSRLQFLEIFFFACQLLDDYQDLKEDKEKKTNQNIFYIGKSFIEQDLIEKSRRSWASALLGQILLNLLRPDVVSGARDSEVLSHFHNSAVEYLELMIGKCPGHAPIMNEKIVRFEDWKFDPLSHIKTSKLEKGNEKYIRPEFMQTYMEGFRDVKLI